MNWIENYVKNEKSTEIKRLKNWNKKKKWRSEKNLKNWNMDENWKLDQNRQYWKNEIVIENWGKKLEIQQKIDKSTKLKGWKKWARAIRKILN